MNDITTIDDLLEAKKVTLEEREFFQDIIEAARKNERKTREYTEQIRLSLTRLSWTLQTMEERIIVLNKALDGLLDAAGTLQLKLIPSEKFYRE